MPGSRALQARLVPCALALAAACAASEERTSLESSIVAVEPACASSAAPTLVTIRGTMPIRPDVSLSSSRSSALDVTYRAWVGETELTDVAWLDASRLAATIPAGIPAGTYALSIESPFGERSALDGFRVAAGPCSSTPLRPAALVVEATASPERVTAGDLVILTIVVRNAGETAATGVRTSVDAPPGFAAFTSDTDALDIAAGSSRTYTWTFSAVSGGGGFGVSASGLDASTRQPVSAPRVDTNDVAVAAQGGVHTYAVGGTIAGLVGSGLTLQLDGGEQLAVPAGATSFAFISALASGESYSVSLALQPSSPTQRCTIANGTGIVAAANVTSVRVSCTTLAYTVGGTVSGLASDGLVLRLNAATDLAIAAGSTAFTFATPLSSGTTWSIIVASQPAGGRCTVSGGAGTIGSGNVTSVVVSCDTTRFTVGGSVAGLAGTGLTLQLNGASDLTVAGDGRFAFPPVPSGSAYTVTVARQPAGPLQTCSVAHGTGTVAGADVTDIAVTCVTRTFHVGGSVSGLGDGKLGLELRSGGATSSLNVDQNGPFTFGAGVPSGAAYTVAVKAQPKGQTCRIQNASGTVGDIDVTDVAVTCQRR